MIRKGISAKTPELTQIAKYNAFCGNPYQWFDTAYFRNCGYHCITFDFFVDWKNKKIQRNIWTKRIIYKDFDISEKGVYNRIEIADGKEEIDNLFKFCGRYGFELEYILLYNIAPDEWNNLDNKIIIFNMSRYLTGGKDVLVFENSYEFRKRIDDVRQQSHSIGEMKGKAKLSYTTSTLEIFLAKDKFIYPGDADIVLLDDSFNAVAIIEVKKHSEGSEKYCELRTESMLRYSSDKYAKYQSQYKDPLKYQSLGYLKDHLKCALYMLFYSTIEFSDKVVKFERVVGSPTDLIPVYPKELPLPEINNEYSLIDFCDSFLKYHKEECLYDFDNIILTDSYDKGKCISQARPSILQYFLHPANCTKEKPAVKKYIEFLDSLK